MKSRLAVLASAVVVVVCFSVIHSRAQTNLTGFWVFRVPTGDGNFRESFFDLKQDGETVTGKQIQNTRELPISEGTFRDGKLHFVVSFTFGNPPQTRTVTYDGTLDGDKFQLTSQFPGRNPVTGTLEHSRPEAAQPPPRLPLPDLHDVLDNGLARTPPMGWNSWNKFAGRVDDASVRGMADAMVSSGMKAAGYVYINIDDTWEGPRDANGNITSNTKFPDMKALADYVHSKGLKIGIYSSPGPKTCAGYEGTYGHEEQDARTWAAWGFDYLKYDWCSADRIYKDDEMQPVYQKMGDALRKVGRPIVFSLCQYGRQEVWKWGSKVGGNLWRTTGDISDNWRSLQSIGFRQFDISQYTRVGHWNDPDMLEIGNGGMTADEYRLHMSLWSMLAAPLLAGNDLRSMTDEIKDILTNAEVIAIDQDPGGNPIQRLPVTDAKQMSPPPPNAPAPPPGALTLVRDLQVAIARELHDGSLAVAFLNRDDSPWEKKMDWAGVGLKGKKIRIRDLWAHKDLTGAGGAPLTESLTVTVPPHGVVLLKVKGL